MKDYPAQVKVQVVFPGHPDPAVHLDAVLDELGASLGDVGLGDADDLACVGGTVLDCTGGIDGDGVGRLEPQFHVGEAVLERLIGRQRTTEGRAVERVLDGEVEDPVGRAHDLGALQYQDGLQLCLERQGRATQDTNYRRGRYPHAVEPNFDMLADHVKPAQGFDPQTGCRGRDEELGQAVGPGGGNTHPV